MYSKKEMIENIIYDTNQLFINRRLKLEDFRDILNKHIPSDKWKYEIGMEVYREFLNWNMMHPFNIFMERLKEKIIYLQKKPYATTNPCHHIKQSDPVSL